MNELREHLSSYLDAIESGATIMRALKTFRDKLGVQTNTSAILELRELVRY